MDLVLSQADTVAGLHRTQGHLSSTLHPVLRRAEATPQHGSLDTVQHRKPGAKAAPRTSPRWRRGLREPRPRGGEAAGSRGTERPLGGAAESRRAGCGNGLRDENGIGGTGYGGRDMGYGIRGTGYERLGRGRRACRRSRLPGGEWRRRCRSR